MLLGMLGIVLGSKRALCKCIMLLNSKARPISRTMIVAVCEIWKGKGSNHVLRCHPEAGTFMPSNKSCRTFRTGSVADIPQFCTQMVITVYILKKRDILSASSCSVAHCTGSDSVNPCSSSEEVENKSFCWNGFCARDLFKHSEAK